jgi:hypothetical protein
MKNWMFVVFVFLTGCYSVAPAQDYCDVMCANTEQNGCGREGCRDRCGRGQDFDHELRCGQESTEFFECLLSHDNICELAGADACEYEADALTSCRYSHLCEDVCTQQEQRGCGEADCVSDCLGSRDLAAEQSCMPAWDAWVLCERYSSACGTCREELNVLEGCVVGLRR